MTTTEPEILAETVSPLRAVYELVASESLLYFEGHFPGRPVLPGVVQVHWAVQFARRGLGQAGRFKGIEALKFHRIIEPLVPLTLTLEQAADTGKLHFSYESADGVHSRGKILFE